MEIVILENGQKMQKKITGETIIFEPVNETIVVEPIPVKPSLEEQIIDIKNTVDLLLLKQEGLL